MAAPRVLLLAAALAAAFTVGGCKGTLPASSQCPPAPPPNRGLSYAQVRAINASSMLELVARVPGVYIERGEIQPRGITTFRGDMMPLVEVDGMVLSARGMTGVNTVSVYDVYSIEWLESGADAALYGSRGGNGVVRIVTRRGTCPD